jgi:hypothetical protein
MPDCQKVWSPSLHLEMLIHSYQALYPWHIHYYQSCYIITSAGSQLQLLNIRFHCTTAIYWMMQSNLMCHSDHLSIFLHQHFHDWHLSIAMVVVNSMLFATSGKTSSDFSASCIWLSAPISSLIPKITWKRYHNWHHKLDLLLMFSRQWLF